MRHQKTRNKLSRDSAHRKSLLMNLTKEVSGARADQDERSQGQGGKARDREADHARQARRPARSSSGAVGALARQVRRVQAVRGGRSPLRRQARRVHAHPQARPASLRRDRDGLPRAGLAPGAAVRASCAQHASGASAARWAGRAIPTEHEYPRGQMVSKLTLQYDGSEFAGWALQPDCEPSRASWSEHCARSSASRGRTESR